MNGPLEITKRMLSDLGVEVGDILGPGIELEKLTFSSDGKISLEIVGSGESAPHPELGELKGRQLLNRLGERLGDDVSPVNFIINSTTLDGKRLFVPEDD